MLAPPTFSRPIEAVHERLNVNDWDGVYIVGDVHGCRRELERLLAELDVTRADLVVYVGDLVRKGPDNHGVVDLVRSSPNMYSVRGNNEEKLLRGEKDPDDLTPADHEYLTDLPVAISFADSLVVHGGVDPRKALADHRVEELQESRSLVEFGGYESPLWYEEYDGPYRVFFGHTPLAAPVDRRYAVGLDTGCVYGNALTAYDWRADEFVAVEPDRTVQKRKASKWVRPRVTPQVAGD